MNETARVAFRIAGGAALLLSALTAAPVRAEPPSWVSDYGTALGEYDDDSRAVDLPFPVTFYGNTYETLYANSNGNVTFNGYNFGWWHTNIPDDVDPWGGDVDNVIAAPLYGDWAPNMNPNYLSDVFTNTVGNAPHRRFVVTWVQVPQYCTSDGVCAWDPASLPNSFQLQIFEGSNQIQFGYNGLTTNGLNWSDVDGDGELERMNVGISSGVGPYLRSASGSEIPALDQTNICFTPGNGLSYSSFVGPCNVTVVALDVQPWRRSNYFSMVLRKDIVLVVYTTDDFDALTVDGSSTRFGDPRLGGIAPMGFVYKDLNGDGRLDFAAKFSGAGLLSAGALDDCTTSMTITGGTTAGEDFVGSDDMEVGEGAGCGEAT